MNINLKQKSVFETEGKTKACNNCLLLKNNKCKFYSCSIEEAAKYNCNMKKPDSHQLQKINKIKQLLLFWAMPFLLSGLFYLFYFFLLIDFYIFDFIFVDFFDYFGYVGLFALTILLSIITGFGLSVLLNKYIKKKRRKKAKRLS